MGTVHKMRGFVMLMAAFLLFAASVSACACPTHSHAAKPKQEKKPKGAATMGSIMPSSSGKPAGK